MRSQAMETEKLPFGSLLRVTIPPFGIHRGQTILLRPCRHSVHFSRRPDALLTGLISNLVTVSTRVDHGISILLHPVTCAPELIRQPILDRILDDLGQLCLIQYHHAHFFMTSRVADLKNSTIASALGGYGRIHSQYFYTSSRLTPNRIDTELYYQSTLDDEERTRVPDLSPAELRNAL